MSNVVPYIHYSPHPVALTLLITTTLKIVWCSVLEAQDLEIVY